MPTAAAAHGHQYIYYYTFCCKCTIFSLCKICISFYISMIIPLQVEFMLFLTYHKKCENITTVIATAVDTDLNKMLVGSITAPLL